MLAANQNNDTAAVLNIYANTCRLSPVFSDLLRPVRWRQDSLGTHHDSRQNR